MGPKSTGGEASLMRRGAEGAWGGRGAGEARLEVGIESWLEGSWLEGWSDSEAGVGASGGEVEDALPWAGAEGSLLLSSGRPNEAKSVSLTGGAGAEGDREALRGMGMGLRALEGIARVGAVEPERRGLREWFAGEAE